MCAHSDVDERHHVRVVEDGSCGGAGEQSCRDLRMELCDCDFVLEDAHGVI